MSEISAGNSSSSKSLMFMTLALFAGFGVMLGGGLFIAKRLAQTMGLAAATGNKDTVRTPIGAFRMEKEDQVGPGLPVYPRASLEVPGDVATGKALSDSKNGVTVVTYHTDDAREFVESWYMKHLSPEFSRHQGSESTFPEAFRNVTIDAGDIAFLAERSNNARAVTLSQDSTGTKISLIQTTSSVTPANSNTTAPQ
jgi:hypothetical protein